MPGSGPQPSLCSSGLHSGQGHVVRSSSTDELGVLGHRPDSSASVSSSAKWRCLPVSEGCYEDSVMQ